MIVFVGIDVSGDWLDVGSLSRNLLFGIVSGFPRVLIPGRLQMAPPTSAHDRRPSGAPLGAAAAVLRFRHIFVVDLAPLP